MLTLISFPRSGRNWLCLLLDVYHGGPVFNNRLNNPSHPDSKDLIGKYIHDHKANKKINGKILYIWRNPVDVIFSMLNQKTIYIKKDRQLHTEQDKVVVWTNRWINHMNKWLVPQYERIHYVKYEQLQLNPIITLAETISFIWPEDTVSVFRCEATVTGVTKSFVDKVCHESNAIVPYTKEDKKMFTTCYSDMILDAIPQEIKRFL